ncbi:sulfatase [Flagellimonas sp. 389]|uniref:sulfatase n=1 Tax=Flagellimonas sp. 389 TaxID=2835862 RepID=UPI001BD4CDCD|nr:sulfatase [Flagellimonas sp. 389]MBS9462585.1 sulfatase [Flagellimonas sp. 389]
MKKIVGVLILSICITSCKYKKNNSTDSPIETQRKPNIVLIVADDLGWSDLGVYGNTYFESPNLDELARNGMRFDNAYAGSHVCSPTRASLLTGRYPARVGLTNYLYGTKQVEDSPVLPAEYENHLPLDEITIAEELKKDGYKTALIGKWHLGENTTFGKSDPKFQGFDITEGFDYELLPVNETYKWYKIGDNTEAYELPHITDEITQNSIKFIEQNKDTTFFMTVAHFAVHLPLQGDSTLVAKYKMKENPRPNDFNPVYGAMIEQMDTSVGKIVKSLEENGLMENTLLVFVSDNGGLAVGEAGRKPTVNDPLRSGKGTMYEGGLRVPMIAYWKGNWEGGYVNSSVISTIDIFPTFLKLVREDENVPQTIDGENKLKAFEAGETLTRESLYFHYPHFSNQGGRPKAALRLGDMKLILSLEDETTELYDLKNDLGEQEDLSTEFPDVTSQMKESIVKWLDDTNAPMPINKIGDETNK